MTIVITVSENVKKKMAEYYKGKSRVKTPPYAIFQADDGDTVITLYESGKAMFQGVTADVDANVWVELEKRLNNKTVNLNAEKEKKEKYQAEVKKYYNLSTIGSDEVGVGDYFGPIVVTASFVSRDKIDFINKLGVKDSKKLADTKILKIAPILMKEIPYVTYILNCNDYNKYQNKGFNMNKIKAILHNKVLYEITHKEEKYDYKTIVIDQFVFPKKYFEHISDAKKIVKKIDFTPKAESKCPSVAVASIISRYIFLKQIDALSESLGIEIPKGANDVVDEVGKEIVLKYSFDKLNDIAKLNFRNTKKIKDLLKEE